MAYRDKRCDKEKEACQWEKTTNEHTDHGCSPAGEGVKGGEFTLFGLSKGRMAVAGNSQMKLENSCRRNRQGTEFDDWIRTNRLP